MTDLTQLRPAILTSLKDAGTTLETACDDTGVYHARFEYILDTRPELLCLDDMHTLASHVGARISDWFKSCETSPQVHGEARSPLPA